MAEGKDAQGPYLRLPVIERRQWKEEGSHQAQQEEHSESYKVFGANVFFLPRQMRLHGASAKFHFASGLKTFSTCP